MGIEYESDLGEGRKLRGPGVVIERGIDGDTQETSFMNATLQRWGDFEFSIAARVDFPKLQPVPFDGESELLFADRLRMVLSKASRAVDHEWDGRAVLTFEVQVGIAGELADEYYEGEEE